MTTKSLTLRKRLLLYTFVGLLPCFSILFNFRSLQRIYSPSKSEPSADIPETAIAVTPFAPKFQSSNFRPACKVLVQNSVPWHYEVLESVWKLFPVKHLMVVNQELCDTRTLQFDYAVVSSYGDERVLQWIEYFNVHLKNSSVFNSRDDNGFLIERRIGNLTVVEQGTSGKAAQVGRLLDIDEFGYDAVVEASCYCNLEYLQLGDRTINWFLDRKRPYRSCIFHEKCDYLKDHSRAVWLTPYSQNYFLPSALPRQRAGHSKKLLNRWYNGKKSTVDICSIGSWKRRNWELLTGFFESPIGEQHSKDVRLNLLGSQGFPPQLMALQMDVLVQEFNSADDVIFHQLESECDVILLLTTRDGQPDYYPSHPKSRQKLSGSIPPIVAYGTSFVLPYEILSFYKAHLPLELPDAGFDSQKSFNSGLHSVLDELKSQRIEHQDEHNSIETVHHEESVEGPNSCSRVQFARPNMMFCKNRRERGRFFGDELGPRVAARVVKHRFQCSGPTPNLPTKNVGTNDTPSGDCLWVGGSAVPAPSLRGHVWSLGLKEAAQSPVSSSNATIHGVRGTVTSKWLATDSNKLQNLNITGDPTFLVPFIFSEFKTQEEGISKSTKAGSNFCFLPHFMDFVTVSKLKDVSNLKFISPGAPLDEVILRIRQCHFIASTSLHGLILADAFGIPALWFAFPGSLVSTAEGASEYMDYFSSLGTPGKKMGRPLKPLGNFSALFDASAYPLALKKNKRREYAKRMVASFPIELFVMDKEKIVRQQS